MQLFERRGAVSGRSQLQELCGVMGAYGDEGHTVSQYHRPNRHNYRSYSHGFGGYLAYLFSSDLVQTNRKLRKCASKLQCGKHEKMNMRKPQNNFVPLICQN